MKRKRNSERQREGRGRPTDGRIPGNPLSRREFLRKAAFTAGGGLLVSCIGGAAQCAAGWAYPAHASLTKPNIILLTADSLRADHVGAYGYARPTTPHLDRLASESSLFEYAFAPISYTGPSLASLHTGKYPQEHFMQFKNGNGLFRNTDPTFAALLQAHGYQTAAFISNRNLERKRSQMDKGFAHYDDTLPEGRGESYGIVSRRNARETAAAALEWLKTRARPPFFLWIHYMEPHGSYAPPPPYNTMFFNDPLYRAEPRLLELSSGQLAGSFFAKQPREQGVRVTPRATVYLEAERGPRRKVLRYNPRVADHIARYDGEIRFLDEEIGRVFQALKTLGLYENSWLLFSSDHGESLGEHGYYFLHGSRLTLELVHVPLLVKPPGKPLPRRVGAQVSLIDLMPTLAEVVGSNIPQGLSGQSILPLLRGERQRADRIVFGEMGFDCYQWFMIDDRYQLLAGYDRPTFLEKGLTRLTVEFNALPVSLFAYRTDPLGGKDLVGVERAAAETRFQELRGFLQGYLERVAQAPRVKRPPVQDSVQTREILKQLGY